ncbi:MAG: YlxR family protein [Anaerolineaceae bacterium]|nr:YlxR family protein [Anaerolineaceae bacterium]
MKTQTGKRVKRVPQRTCVGCREVLSKRTLIRVVRTPEGIRIDPTGKVAGRGAYLHDRKNCWEHALQGALEHALKVNLSANDREALLTFMGTLPSDPSSLQAAGSDE